MQSEAEKFVYASRAARILHDHFESLPEPVSGELEEVARRAFDMLHDNAGGILSAFALTATSDAADAIAQSWGMKPEKAFATLRLGSLEFEITLDVQEVHSDGVVKLKQAGDLRFLQGRRPKG